LGFSHRLPEKTGKTNKKYQNIRQCGSKKGADAYEAEEFQSKLKKKKSLHCSTKF
jgi:hypothetical protein